MKDSACKAVTDWKIAFENFDLIIHFKISLWNKFQIPSPIGLEWDAEVPQKLWWLKMHVGILEVTIIMITKMEFF